MFYLANEKYFVENYGNPNRVTLSDRFDDRCHFDSKLEAKQVARGLKEWGEFEVFEEEPSWMLAHISWKGYNLYKRSFPLIDLIDRPLIWMEFHQELKLLEWVASFPEERTQRVFIHLEEGSLSFAPVDGVRLFVGKYRGQHTTVWTGLDRVYLTPSTRDRCKAFATDFWSLLRPLQPAMMAIFERAAR